MYPTFSSSHLILSNSALSIRLDPNWPQIIAFSATDGATFSGGAENYRFALRLNETTFEAEELVSRVSQEGDSVFYCVEIPALDIELSFQIALRGNELTFGIPRVEEKGDFRLHRLEFPGQRLVSFSHHEDFWFLRQLYGRRSWSADWIAGTGGGGGEEIACIGDSYPDPGPMPTRVATVWNSTSCLALASSIAVAPFVTQLERGDQRLDERAGRFSIGSGAYSYRLNGQINTPLEVTVAVLGDYNGNGLVDWCDAAMWSADCLVAHGVADHSLYRETIVYKLYLDDVLREKPLRTFAECLPLIRRLHDLSEGLPQVIYLVGWQDRGHDTAYPAFGPVNERLGGRSALLKLIADAKQLNATVSLHVNLDDSYFGNPEFDEGLLSRDPNGRLHLWFCNHENGGQEVYSINHTLSMQSGYEKSRLDRLTALLPLEKTIHCDAHRRHNEVWLEDGTHIDAECEVQLGLLPIKKLYLERGLDITTEHVDGDGLGLYSWGHVMSSWTQGYETVMLHGRSTAPGRRGLEGEALGRAFVQDEFKDQTDEETAANFVRFWLYAQLLARKPMLNFRVGSWNEGVEAWYADDTYVRSGRGGAVPTEGETIYEGLCIARGANRFLPWRKDVCYLYHETSEPLEWTLPPHWVGRDFGIEPLCGADNDEPAYIVANGAKLCARTPTNRAYRLRLR